MLKVLPIYFQQLENENVSQTRLIMKYVFINCKIVFALTRHFLHDYVNNVIGSEKNQCNLLK